MKKLTFFIFCLEGAILSFNVGAAAALIPSIAKDFNVSQFIAGRIVWLYMFPYGAAALLYGPLVRTFDAKKIELVCFLLFSFSNLLAAVSGNVIALFTARFFMGVFGASVIPLVLILIANHTETKNRGRLIGVFFSATFAASLLGLFLSGIISWRLIFLIPAILGFIVWGFMYFYLPNFAPDTQRFKIYYTAALRDKNVVGIFTYIFLISLFYHGVQQWLAVYFSSQFKFNQFLVSMLITLTSLSGIFGEVIGGYLSDKIGRLKTVNFGIILMILAVLFLTVKLPVVILALIMIIWGMGWTFNHSGLSTLLTDLPGKFLNEAASLNSSVRFLAGGMGAALGGMIMQRNFTLAFLIFGICLVGMLVFSKKNRFILEG